LFGLAPDPDSKAVADVWHDEQAGAWLLRMRSTCYAFAVGSDGAALRHLHWGAGLPPAALAGLRAGARGGPSERHRTWALESPDEYVPWGGMRYDEPSLKVDYPDGTRGIEWQVGAQRVTRGGGTVSCDRVGASEYLADDGSEVVVLAWWGPGQAGGPLPALRLLGIDPGLRYREAGTGQEHWGAALMQQGLRLPDDAGLDFGTALVRLTRVSDPA
jgi:hypothetical protein